MLFKQPVVGILGAAAFVVVGLFMSSLMEKSEFSVSLT